MTKNRNAVSLSAIVAVAIIGVLFTAFKGWTPGLGLDLQGGASLVYQPVGAFKQSSLEQAKNIIRQRVDGLGVAEPDVRLQGNNIIVELPGIKDANKAFDTIGQTAELRFRPVLQQIAPIAPQVTGGTTTTVKGGSGTTVAPPRSTLVTIGGTGSQTVVVGNTTIATTIAPSSRSTTSADFVAPSAGSLRGFAVGAQTSTATTQATGTTKAAVTSLPANTTLPTKTTPIGDLDTKTGTTPRSQDKAEATVVLADKQGNRYILEPTMLTGTIVSDATAEINATTGAWVVNVVFTGAGSAKWDQMAQKLYQRQLAIVLDSEVISAPVIQTTQFGGKAQISGTFDAKEARRLAIVLRYGSLPVKLEPQTVQTVSASLGKDSLRAGIITGLIGLALVAAYMMFYYRALGLVVIAGVSVSACLLWTITALLTQSRGLALSLSGAVGIIVSVGVSVDSYVVYFERLRDEVRHGKTLRSSVDRGFKRAWRTILAADLVSLIGALALYFLTVGGVRGFAFFLALSTALDLVVSYFFTRPIVALLGRGTFFTTGRMGVAHNMDISATQIAVGTSTRILPGSGSRAVK